MLGKLLITVALCAIAPAAAMAAPGETLPDSARACVSLRTPITRALPGASLAARLAGREVQVASMVLCVNRPGPAPLAVRTLVSTACRGEWKASDFAVRYGGGTYTSFGQCIRYKGGVAAAALALAQSRGSRACAAELRAGRPLLQAESPRFGFGIYVVPGTC